MPGTHSGPCGPRLPTPPRRRRSPLCLARESRGPTWGGRGTPPAVGAPVDALADVMAGGFLGLLLTLVGVHASLVLGELTRRRLH